VVCSAVPYIRRPDSHLILANARRLPEYESIRRQFEQTWSVAEMERRKRAKRQNDVKRSLHQLAEPHPIRTSGRRNSTCYSGKFCPSASIQPRARPETSQISNLKNAAASRRMKSKQAFLRGFRETHNMSNLSRSAALPSDERLPSFGRSSLFHPIH